MSRNAWLALAGVVVFLSGSIGAEQDNRAPVARPSLRLDDRWVPESGRATAEIIGAVIDSRQIPVEGARVRLRDLNKGTVEQASITDQRGEYRFEVEEASTYVVEMVVADGRVIALSNAGTVSRFETLRTLIQLPGRWDLAQGEVVEDQHFTDFLGMSAALTMTASTLEIATAQQVTPADPGEPVSAFKSQ